MKKLNVLYKIIKDYKEEISDKQSEDVRNWITGLQHSAIDDYKALHGKRDVEKFRI